MRKGLLILFASLSFVAEAQLIKRPVILESKVYTGIHIPFFYALDYLATDNIYTFDILLSFPTYGDDYWERLYNYPRTGTGISLSSLGNKEILGNAWSLYRFINIPVYRMRDKLSLNYQASIGCAFLDNPFNVNNNHLNRATGSYLNLYVRMGLDVRVKLLQKSEIVFEAGFTHFSNGKTKSPNYGVNIGSVSLGLNYLFNDKGSTLKEPEIPELAKKFDQSVMISAGKKVYNNLAGIVYLTSSASYNIERRLTNASKIGLGPDLFYDASNREAIAGDDKIPEDDFAKMIRFGLHASYSARYKKTLFGIQVGYYLYSKSPLFTKVYNRVSLQYLFSNKIFGTMAVKSHMGKADCLELGIGYLW